MIQVGVNAVSGLFMIYCFLVFQEQQKFPIALSAAFAFQVLLDLVLTTLNLVEAAATGSPSLQL